jgi:VIT1/CCC1 family predicted Fe2+/Mn2+ transporter
MRRFIESHLASNQVARVVYGAIIGLALVVALEAHPPPAGAVVASLLGTGLAVALAEVYSETLGAEVRTHARVEGESMRAIWTDTLAVVFGVAFPAVFFVLAAAGAMDVDTAFDAAKWTGLGLIALYGFIAARLSGASLANALVKSVAVALIGAFLIALKALVH